MSSSGNEFQTVWT